MRAVEVVAVGMAPNSIEQMLSVWIRTMRVFDQSAFRFLHQPSRPKAFLRIEPIVIPVTAGDAAGAILS